MRRATATLLTAMVLLLGCAAAGRCEADRVLMSSSFAHVELDGTVPQTAGPSDFNAGVGYEWTIRALSDEEIAFLMRDTIDPRWKESPTQKAEADRDSFAMAAALGTALQRLAGFWDPPLASVLLWLPVLALMLRPPRPTRADDQS